VAAAGGDYTAARRLHEESLAIYRTLGDRSGMAGSMEGLAAIAFASGEPSRAACIWGGSERLREEIGTPPVPSERHLHDMTVAAARATLADDVAFDRAWQKGRAMSLDGAIACALGNPGA
jgi:non-specific serine/threonine protein kinase